MGKSNKTSGDLSSFVFDKLQPQALEMEEAVLGAMMLDKDAVSNVIDILKAESFYLDKHQKIYACFQELFLKNKPIDLLTVTEQLKKSGVLEEIGGAFYLTQLASRIGSTANVEHHARVVSEKHILRELIKSSNMIIKGAYDETIDVFDLLDKSEQALFEITDQNLRRNFESMGNLLNQAIKQMEELAQNDNAVVGIPSGFTALDRVTSGWQRSDLIIMAARPGMGKTSMVLALARNACVDHKKPIAFFSLEMSSLQLVNRLISSEAELPQEKMKRGELESYEWEQLHSKIQNLSDAKLFIDDTPGLNIFELRAKCRRLKMQHDIQMVVIDYLQLMSGTGDKKGNREQEISQISRALKGIAKELNIPVIALSQLSRAVETRGGNKRPQLSDLRECITGDTKIFLPDSGEYIPVKELLGKNGFNVLALNETDYKLQKSKCLDVWETGKKEIYELTTQSGYKIKTSLNHPFYTVNGWRQMVDLKVGDFVASPRKLDNFKERNLSSAPETNYGSTRYQSNLSRERIGRVADLLKEEELQNLYNSDIKWEKIKSIEHIGNEMTYDIHVEDTHNFVADNFIVHNSGAIEQDADMVIFLYRPEYYGFDQDDDGNPTAGIGEVIIAKHRNGALDTVKVRWVGQFAKFKDLDFMDGGQIEGFVPLNQIITKESKMNDNGPQPGYPGPPDDDIPF